MPALFLFFVDLVFRGLYVVLIVYAVMSWFSPYPRHTWQRWVAAVAEPLLLPFRKLIPSTGGMDFSPMLAGIALLVLQQILFRAMQP